MKTVIISDVDNTLRRQNVKTETSRVGLDFTFFDAIMANRMDPDEVASKALPNTFLTRGEIGCALSHLGVMREFLSSEEKSILICEDDIYFTDEFSEERVHKIRQFVEATDEPRVVVLQKSIYHYKPIQKVDDTLHIYSAVNFFCMHGYIVNRKAAENIIQIQTPLCFEIDAFKFYYWLQKCDLYCLDKDLIIQAGESNIPSTILGRHDDDTGKLTKKESFKILYNRLSFTDKLICNWRRLRKALHKPFESLNY